MIRPFTLVCMLLAVGSGLYLYRVKYRAQLLDREISATLRSADDARARAALLRADYALLNDPIRLQELVEQHLAIRPTQPGQFTTMAEFERRLPPIGLAPPEPTPEPEIPSAIIRPDPKAPAAAPPPPPAAIAAVPAPPPRPVAAVPATAPVAVVQPAPLVAAVRPAPPAAAPRPPTPLALPTAVAVAPPASAIPATTTPATATPVSASAGALPHATQLAIRSTAPSTPQPSPPPPRAPTAAAAPPPPARTAAADSGPPVVRSSLGMARRMQSPQVSPGGGGEN